jgi:hypothetical protein
MKKLAIAATIAAGLAVAAPVQAQAYDDIGPPLVGGVVTGVIIGGGDPYGYYGPGYGYGGRYGRVYHGPFYDRTVVYVLRRIQRRYDGPPYSVNYYYPAPAYYGRPLSAGCCW